MGLQIQIGMLSCPVSSSECHSLPASVFCFEPAGNSRHPLSSSSTFLQTARAGHPVALVSSSASISPSLFRFRKYRSSPSSSEVDSTALQGPSGDDHDDEYDDDDIGSSESSFSDTELPSVNGGDDAIEIEIEKTGNNCRRIRSNIAVEANLETLWAILTDYERLADFIPGLAVSKLLDKRENCVRLFQIGEQNLAFGLKFNAKGIVDCYEKDLECYPYGRRRDIEFNMIDGDFKLFKGKWSIEQCNIVRGEKSDTFVGQDYHTTLSYTVDVEPKLWLPVGLVEGRLCREITVNLSCIRDEAQKAFQNTLLDH